MLVPPGRDCRPASPVRGLPAPARPPNLRRPKSGRPPVDGRRPPSRSTATRARARRPRWLSELPGIPPPRTPTGALLATTAAGQGSETLATRVSGRSASGGRDAGGWWGAALQFPTTFARIDGWGWRQKCPLWPLGRDSGGFPALSRPGATWGRKRREMAVLYASSAAYCIVQLPPLATGSPAFRLIAPVLAGPDRELVRAAAPVTYLRGRQDAAPVAAPVELPARGPQSGNDGVEGVRPVHRCYHPGRPQCGQGRRTARRQAAPLWAVI